MTRSLPGDSQHKLSKTAQKKNPFPKLERGFFETISASLLDVLRSCYCCFTKLSLELSAF